MVTRKVDKCKVCHKPQLMWVPHRAYLPEDAHKSKRYTDLTTGHWVSVACKCPRKKAV